MTRTSSTSLVGLLGSSGLPILVDTAQNVIWRQWSVAGAVLLLPVLTLPVLKRLWLRIKQDYDLFLSLGPGGTPSTPLGYLKVSMLRFLIANRNVLRPPLRDGTYTKGSAYFQDLRDLPPRRGQRPQLAGIAPQRQMDQQSDHEQIFALRRAMQDMASENTDTLQTGRSCFEKNSLGLFLREGVFARHREQTSSGVTSANFKDLKRAFAEQEFDSDDEATKWGPEGTQHPTCGLPPEVAHMHGSEGSLHLTLHPEDAAIVIEKGWGERHPLAGVGGLVRDIFNGKGITTLCTQGPSEGWLPAGFIMVYAPRTAEDRRAVGQIVRAGAWWVGGIRLKENNSF